jgi:hypothetical protein
MRVRFFFLAVSVSLVASAAGMQACGGTEESSPQASNGDAGQEAAAPADAAKPDTGAPDTGVDSSPCDTNADFTANIPDAAIADGASSTGLCVACAQANCADDISDCNHLCECQGLMDDALDCYAKNPGNPIACAGPFLGASKETQSIGASIIGCLQKNCEAECPTGVKDAGADG